MKEFDFDSLGTQLEAWVDSVEQSTTRGFRASVWTLFNRILEQTPQGSGRAVANWRLSRNTPDLSWDPDAGDPPDVSGAGLVVWAHRKKGDRKWIDYARDHNKYLVSTGSGKADSNRIRLGDRVFITNNVQGDQDEGDRSPYYLAELQDPQYWAQKLRSVNQPYETVAQTLLMHEWSEFRDADSTYLGEFLDKAVP